MPAGLGPDFLPASTGGGRCPRGNGDHGPTYGFCRKVDATAGIAGRAKVW